MARLPVVGFGVVGREVDQRAEHLEIGDECIHLGDPLGIAVEIFGTNVGVAAEEASTARLRFTVSVTVAPGAAATSSPASLTAGTGLPFSSSETGAVEVAVKSRLRVAADVDVQPSCVPTRKRLV